MSPGREDNVTFGERLKMLRLDADMSQSELADASGLNPATISLLEARVSRPGLTSLDRLPDGLWGNKVGDLARQCQEWRERAERAPAETIVHLPLVKIAGEIELSHGDRVWWLHRSGRTQATLLGADIVRGTVVVRTDGGELKSVS